MSIHITHLKTINLLALAIALGACSGLYSAEPINIYIAQKFDRLPEPLKVYRQTTRSHHGKPGHLASRVSLLMQDNPDVLCCDVEGHDWRRAVYQTSDQWTASLQDILWTAKRNVPSQTKVGFYVSQNFAREEDLAELRSLGIERIADFVLLECYIGNKHVSHLPYIRRTIRDIQWMRETLPEVPVVVALDTNFWQGSPEEDVPAIVTSTLLEHCKAIGVDVALFRFKIDFAKTWEWRDDLTVAKAIWEAMGEDYLQYLGAAE